jgi:hypothetical protein
MPVNTRSNGVAARDLEAAETLVKMRNAKVSVAALQKMPVAKPTAAAKPAAKATVKATAEPIARPQRYNHKAVSDAERPRRKTANYKAGVFAGWDAE